MKSSSTILVTGGAGFIGANLVHTFVKQGKSPVHILTEKNTNLWRLESILSSLIIHEVDLANFDAIQHLVETIKPKIIFHLASYGGMPHQDDQKIIYDVNFYGTVNLLNACKKIGFDCFINTGSSSEYGMRDEAMYEEMVLKPISDYAVAKAAATQFCLKEALFYKLPVYTLRPFSVYGDYEMPTRLIPTIVVNAILNKPIELSSPHPVRDYIYIHDLIDLYRCIADQKPTNMHIFNGGTGIQSSVQDVINTVQKQWPCPLHVEFGKATPRPWEPTTWKAEITKTSQVLDWKPRYSLNDGLLASLEWFEKNIALYDTQTSTINSIPKIQPQPQKQNGV